MARRPRSDDHAPDRRWSGRCWWPAATSTSRSRGARSPLPPGYAVGHEGSAEVVAVGDDVSGVQVGDRVVVPFQISCGDCRECRRGVTGSCGSLPMMAMYGLGPLAGLDGGGFMSRSGTRALRRRDADPRSGGRRPGRHRLTVGQHSRRLARDWPLQRGAGGPRPGRSPRAGVGRLSIGLYAAAFAAALGCPCRLRRHRFTSAGRRGETRRRRARRRQAGQILGSLSGHRAHLRRFVVAWPPRCGRPGRTGCAPTPGFTTESAVEMPLLPMYTRGVRFVTGRVSARAVIPEILEVTVRRAAICHRSSSASSPGRTRHRSGRR